MRPVPTRAQQAVRPKAAQSLEQTGARAFGGKSGKPDGKFIISETNAAFLNSRSPSHQA